MSLKKFNKRWEKMRKLAQIVQTLDKNDDYEDAFNGYHRDFLEFLQTNYEDVAQEALRFAFMGGIRQRLDYAKQVFKERRIRDTQYGLNHLEDIVDGLGNKLKNIAVSLLPIKDTDIDNVDNLDNLIDSYRDNIKTLESNFGNINQEREPEMHQAQQRTIQECKEFESLLQDYKGLVKNIIKYRMLAKYLEGEGEGERGRPDNAKMNELFNVYLSELSEQYKAESKDKYEDNAPLIEAARALSGDSNHLVAYYVSSILGPAKEKLDIEIERVDLKNYVKRNVNIANINKQMQFFEGVYSLSAQKED